MQSPPSTSGTSPPYSASQETGNPEMDTAAAAAEMNPHPLFMDDPSSALFDWSALLDFSLDDKFTIPYDSISSPYPAIPSEPEPSEVSPTPDSSAGADRIRKRDPRLTCSNFLAGRVPCACPEMDALLEEEERNAPGKKRPRTARVPAGPSLCQVPGCEADISELKGYHRRHRVCLRCANAAVVVIHDHSKRYCQQCGKFHVLSDFDDGKRSCRRKLERHNNRRRRKPSDSKGSIEKEAQPILLPEDSCGDDEPRKENTCLSTQIVEKEAFLEPEGQISALGSANSSQNIEGDSGGVSIETLVDQEKDNIKFNHSPSYCDNKSTFSSMCPTGRISFKLYDWNPAEFPRRLRHQIFQWLSSMPVELEGYIRPGCTILTAFISMPKYMWVKLFEDPIVYIHNFVIAPENMLYGRGTLLVHLNDMIFCVMKDGTSVVKVKVMEKRPKLHYVHPFCFEAGKPMEFVACGVNLLQPKFRFLISFAGKYLEYEFCVSPIEGKNINGFDHQLLKIHVPHTEPDLFGPAFIEVDNESGVSNFIPILIGNGEICSEMNSIHLQLGSSNQSQSSCQESTSKQQNFSNFALDIAYILREPPLDDIRPLQASQIQRFNHLLKFLIEIESVSILERALYYMKIVIDRSLLLDIADDDLRHLQRKMDFGGDVLAQRKGQIRISLIQSSENDVSFDVSSANQDTKITDEKIMATHPLLSGEVVMSVDLTKDRSEKPCGRLFRNTVLTSHRHLIAVAAVAAVCFGVCAVLFHPREVGEFTTTIRRCLMDNS